MTFISVTYDPRKLDQRTIERFLERRMFERSSLRWASAISISAFGAVIFVLGLFLDELGTGPLWLLPALAAYLCFEVCRRIAIGKFRMELDAAPVRNRPSTTIELSEAGVDSDGMKLQWAEIIDVLRGPGAVILMYLPIMGIVIPDDALPAGLSAEGLMAQIAEWRAN
jgi:hypothetical protein